MKKALIWIMVAVFAISLSFVGAGCAKEAAETPAAEEETTVAETTATETKAAELEWVESSRWPEDTVPVIPDKKIYYVESFVADLLHKMMIYGAESVFKDAQCQYEVLNPENDLQKQVKMIDDILAKGDADAIIINPTDSEGISASVEKCNEAGIPVFGIDRWPTAGRYEFGCGGDWYGHGELATNYMIERLEEKYGEPKGNVVALISGMNINSMRDRVFALRDIMENYPNIKVDEKILEFKPEVFAKTLQDTLTADPTIDAVWNHADYFGPSYNSVMTEIGELYPVGDPNHIILVSMDGTDFGLQNVKDGYWDSTCSLWCTDWGYFGAWAAVNYLGGVTDLEAACVVPDELNGKFTPQETGGIYLSLGSVLVTQENVDDPNLIGNVIKEMFGNE